MLGAIIGDIVGSRWEFNPTNDYDFEWLKCQNKEVVKHIGEILKECEEFSGYDLNIKKEDVINRFDETCQGTVPVALWIIGQSTSFEDAVRKAVALGADADTLGAIVGSIAEAIWGIPESMKTEIMVYLPDEMKAVVKEFYEYIK